MLKLKQYFCKHDFTVVAEHESCQQSLWQCDKCKVYNIVHYGIALSYRHKTPHIGGWIYNDKVI